MISPAPSPRRYVVVPSLRKSAVAIPIVRVAPQIDLSSLSLAQCLIHYTVTTVWNAEPTPKWLQAMIDSNNAEYVATGKYEAPFP